MVCGVGFPVNIDETFFADEKCLFLGGFTLFPVNLGRIVASRKGCNFRITPSRFLYIYTHNISHIYSRKILCLCFETVVECVGKGEKCIFGMSYKSCWNPLVFLLRAETSFTR